jgi:hypothetical protein
LEYDRGGHNTKLVCACCGSSVGVGETMVGHRVDSSRAVATDGGVSDEGETVVVGASVGESTERARARATAEQYVERHGEPDVVTPGLLGEIGVSPEYADVVCEVVNGESGPSVEAVEGPARSSGSSRYELQELVAWNGDSETPGEGGGACYSELQLPVEELIRGTRLQYVGDESRPNIVVSIDGERFATYNPVTAARKLMNAGLRIPWVADRSLEFERYDRAVFEEPVSRPGADDSVQEPDTDEAETAQEHNTSQP